MQTSFRNNPEITFKPSFSNGCYPNINRALLPGKTLTEAKIYLNKNPAFIFHHFMKCGGTTVAKSLRKWFKIIYDQLKNPQDILEYKNHRYDIENINSDTCLVGHYAYEGTYLFQRYPEAITEKNTLKTFTFIKNPLSFYVSFYYYTLNKGRLNCKLTDFFDSNKNLLAYYLPCDESNYKEILDRYFFIGITERMQESFDKLANILNKRKIRIPHLNKSDKDEQISILTKDFIEKFKEKNKLDYMIYDYCIERFNKT
jgi:hypothetical protein